MSDGTHSLTCPWCTWRHTAFKAAHVAARWVHHCIYAHDLFPDLDKAEFFVLGDPSSTFEELKPKHRRPGDERPWREIRGSA